MFPYASGVFCMKRHGKTRVNITILAHVLIIETISFKTLK